ncbi:MAG: hypothetical protein KBD78_06950 [Oligoflexales bacterium]|nr:hypothetical protein [Oligoflexales bacterium]
MSLKMFKSKTQIFCLFLFWAFSSQVYAKKEAPLLLRGFVKSAVTTTNKPLLYRENASSTPNYYNSAVVGVNASRKVSKDAEAVLQFIAEGDDFDYQLKMDLAFLKLKLNNNFNLRFGLQKAPIWLFSDYIDIGLAYPWVDPPDELYNMNPIGNFSGLSIVYERELSETLNFLFEPFLGGISEHYEQPMFDETTKVKGRINLGVYFALVHDLFTFRSSFAEGRISADNFGIEDWKLHFWSAGINSQWKSLIFIAEYAQVQEVGTGENKTESLRKLEQEERVLGELIQSVTPIPPETSEIAPFVIPDIQKNLALIQQGKDLYASTAIGHKAYYATLGYQWKKFTPHLTFAKLMAPQSELVVGGDQSSIKTGVRYDLDDDIALKGEVHFVNIPEGGKGLYSTADSGIDIRYTRILRLGVDLVF